MSLLDEAIIDAITLKEAALKNAEAMVLERYSVDVKKALENMLNEQEEDAGVDLGALGATPEAPTESSEVDKIIPFAFFDRNKKGVADKEKLCKEEQCPEDEEQIEIPLRNIAEALNIRLRAVKENKGGYEVNKGELLDVLEQLTVDARVVPHGHTYLATNSEIEHANELARAKQVQLNKEREEEYGKLKKENKDLKTKIFSYQNKMKEIIPVAEALADKVEQYEAGIKTLQEKLGNLTLSNAKLLYKNRILSNDSLNERQKTKIVESLTNAKTIEQAKVIYETLQSATQSVDTRMSNNGPKSLSEAIVRNSASIAERMEHNSVSSPAIERMRVLAGITKK